MSVWNDVNYRTPDPKRWLIVSDSGSAVVCVYDPGPLFSQLLGQRGRCLDKITKWEFKVILKKAEYETIALIGDLPTIDITDFDDWENDYADGIRGSECQNEESLVASIINKFRK